MEIYAHWRLFFCTHQIYHGKEIIKVPYENLLRARDIAISRAEKVETDEDNNPTYFRNSSKVEVINFPMKNMRKEFSLKISSKTNDGLKAFIESLELPFKNVSRA